ncbi:MAG: hypothetical protein HY681_12895 [Chloroflexi bacterium]|nr:hypothetical protein [Chloroflexota bacterium]
MERPIQTIKDICQGRKAITSDIALDLEQTLGIKASTWTNLEAIYRSALARQRRRQADSQERVA